MSATTMNDSQRGTVWEESIIHCPRAVQTGGRSRHVALSAGQLTDLDRAACLAPPPW